MGHRASLGGSKIQSWQCAAQILRACRGYCSVVEEQAAVTLSRNYFNQKLKAACCHKQTGPHSNGPALRRRIR